MKFSSSLSLAPMLLAVLAHAQTITPTALQNNVAIGDLSQALDLNHDGSVVVGHYTHNGQLLAYIWSNGTLILPSCGSPSMLFATNASGTMATGGSNFGSSATTIARWISPSPCLGSLPQPGGYLYSMGRAMSSAGDIIVGYTESRAVKWTNANPSVLPVPGNDDSTHALAVSADGSIIVGAGFHVTSNPGKALLWNSTGVHVLGALGPGGDKSIATGISASGAVVVGESNTQPGGPPRAFLWNQAEGMINLGLLPGATAADYSTAAAVSADGAVVIGMASVSGADHPFLWRADLGMIRLVPLLVALGVNFTPWYGPNGIINVTAISDDATALCGLGWYNPTGSRMGYVVRGLPKLCGPLIYDHTPSHTLCAGDLALLNVSAWHPPQAQYQWFRRYFADPIYFVLPVNDGGNISGATTPTLVITNVQPSQAGDYFCRITGGCAPADSPIIELGVKPAPVITQQPPLSLLPCGHGPANLSLTATSTAGPIAYQWQAEVPFGSNNFVNLANGLVSGIGTVAGAQSPSLTLTNFHFGGHTAYRCRLANSCGVTLSLATLVVPCFADYNCDGSVDFFDYLDFIADYSSDDPSADINRDGSVDFFDYLDYVGFYNNGC